LTAKCKKRKRDKGLRLSRLREKIACSVDITNRRQEGKDWAGKEARLLTLRTHGFRSVVFAWSFSHGLPCFVDDRLASRPRSKGPKIRVEAPALRLDLAARHDTVRAFDTGDFVVPCCNAVERRMKYMQSASRTSSATLALPIALSILPLCLRGIRTRHVSEIVFVQSTMRPWCCIAILQLFERRHLTIPASAMRLSTFRWS